MNNLIGQKFGRLEVLERAENSSSGQIRWLCRCSCEDKNEIIVQGGNLQSGHTKSCGCLVTKHEHYGDKTYKSWAGMQQRCANPNCKDYKNYGGRGIKICKRWMCENGFIHFLEDMGEAPKGLQIDRINNNKNYCKSNCRWATRKQQNRNVRSNRLKTYEGKTQCIAAWAEEYNIPSNTLWMRLYKYNWLAEKAFKTPVKTKKGKKNGN